MRHVPGIRGKSWREELRAPVYRIFNDDLMIGLAMVLTAVVILRLFFNFSPAMLVLFDAVDYIVVGAFVAEYALKVFVAKSRVEFSIEIFCPKQFCRHNEPGV